MLELALKSILSGICCGLLVLLGGLAHHADLEKQCLRGEVIFTDQVCKKVEVKK